MKRDQSAEIAEFVTLIASTERSERRPTRSGSHIFVEKVKRKFPNANADKIWRGFRIARELQSADFAFLKTTEGEQ